MKLIIASLLLVAVTGQFTDKTYNSTEDRYIYGEPTITLKLYNRENKDLHPNGVEISAVINDPGNMGLLKRPLKVFIHGYRTKGDKYPAMPRNFLDDRYARYFGDVDVIMVTWPSKIIDYGLAAYRAMDVGERVARWLYPILRQYDGCGVNLHLIGHSLGAHAVGEAGRLLTNRGCSPNRVTGLDPAGPKFEWGLKTLFNSRRHLINKDSGRFVDIIHTNPGVFGVKREYGHVNFYVDGGYQNLAQIRRNTPLYNSQKSHSHATKMFMQSIVEPWKFPSQPCDDVQPKVNTYYSPICVLDSARLPYTSNYLGIRATPPNPMESGSYWTDLPPFTKEEMEALKRPETDGPEQFISDE